MEGKRGRGRGRKNYNEIRNYNNSNNTPQYNQSNLSHGSPFNPPMYHQYINGLSMLQRSYDSSVSNLRPTPMPLINNNRSHTLEKRGYANILPISRGSSISQDTQQNIFVPPPLVDMNALNQHTGSQEPTVTASNIIKYYKNIPPPLLTPVRTPSCTVATQTSLSPLSTITPPRTISTQIPPNLNTSHPLPTPLTHSILTQTVSTSYSVETTTYQNAQQNISAATNYEPSKKKQKIATDTFPTNTETNSTVNTEQIMIDQSPTINNTDAPLAISPNHLTSNVPRLEYDNMMSTPERVHTENDIEKTPQSSSMNKESEELFSEQVIDILSYFKDYTKDELELEALKLCEVIKKADRAGIIAESRILINDIPAICPSFVKTPIMSDLVRSKMVTLDLLRSKDEVIYVHNCRQTSSSITDSTNKPKYYVLIDEKTLEQYESSKNSEIFSLKLELEDCKDKLKVSEQSLQTFCDKNIKSRSQQSVENFKVSIAKLRQINKDLKTQNFVLCEKNKELNVYKQFYDEEYACVKKLESLDENKFFREIEHIIEVINRDEMVQHKKYSVLTVVKHLYKRLFSSRQINFEVVKSYGELIFEFEKALEGNKDDKFSCLVVKHKKNYSLHAQIKIEGNEDTQEVDKSVINRYVQPADDKSKVIEMEMENGYFVNMIIQAEGLINDFYNCNTIENVVDRLNIKENDLNFIKNLKTLLNLSYHFASKCEELSHQLEEEKKNVHSFTATINTLSSNNSNMSDQIKSLENKIGQLKVKFVQEKKSLNVKIKTFKKVIKDRDELLNNEKHCIELMQTENNNLQTKLKDTKTLLVNALENL